MKGFLLIILSFTFINIYCQNNSFVDWVSLSFEEKEKRRITAKSEIENIKSNGIIIRIEDYKDAINELESVGNYVYANELREKTKNRKDKQLSLVNKLYDFSPVYFYNSSDANILIEKGDKSVLYDYKNEPVDTTLIRDLYLAMYHRSDYEVHTTKEYFFIYKVDYGQARRITHPFPQMIRFKHIWKKTTFGRSVSSLSKILSYRYENGF